RRVMSSIEPRRTLLRPIVRVDPTSSSTITGGSASITAFNHNDLSPRNRSPPQRLRVTSARAIFWTVPTSFLTGRGAAGGLPFISTIGSLGGFAGPFMVGWIKQETGSFILGLLALAAVLAVTTAFSAGLQLLIRRD